MSYLAKVTAIHPRGRKWEGKAPPAASQPKGDSLREKLDWLSTAAMEIAGDYNFSENTNSLLYEIQTHHGLITDSMPIEKRLEESLKLANLVPKLGKELQSLYGKGALPEEIDRKTLHKFIEEAKAVGKQTTALVERMNEYNAWVKKVRKLGF